MLTKEDLLDGAITFGSNFLTVKQRLDVELPEGWYITEEEVREAVEKRVGPDRSAETKRVVNIIINELFDVWPSDLLDDSEEGEEPEYEVGDLVRYKGRDPLDNYIITGQHEAGCDDCGCYDSKHFSVLCGTGSSGYIPVDKQDNFEQLGAFQPTPEFFERVPKWVTGELVVSHEHSDGPEITLEVTGGDPNDETILMHEDGNTEIAPEQVIDRTGIVLSVSNLEFHSQEDEMTEQTDDELNGQHRLDNEGKCIYCEVYMPPEQTDEPCPERGDGGDDMTDDELTHEMSYDTDRDWTYCIHCNEDFNSIQFEDPCPEHPDREDDDSTERKIAEVEFNLLRSNIKQIHRVADTALSDLEALRSQLELADDDGVCEWTYDKTHCKWDAKCGDGFSLLDPNDPTRHYTYCPSCGKPIEIVEEGEEQYGVGDLVKRSGTPPLEYAFIVDRSQMGTMYKQGGDYVADDGYDIEKKVGHFHPTPQFFERVPDFTSGELVIEHMPDGHDRVGLWPGTQPGNIDYGVLNSEGESRAFTGDMTERTGIIVSAEQLESVFCEEE